MQPLALITDSTAGLSPHEAQQRGIRVAAASYALANERRIDGSEPWDAFYARMSESTEVPRTFGVTERAFIEAFEAGLEAAEGILCLVTPYDVNPSFTTAAAAGLSVQYDRPDAQIKVLNPGVGAAGLGALLLSLASGLSGGCSSDTLLAALEALEPQCDSLFVPADVRWIEQAGRLEMIEDRIGRIEDGGAVVRVGTRITGVERTTDRDEALGRAVELVGRRPGNVAMNVVLVHAAAEGDANRMAAAMRARWNVAELVIGELTATHGSQLGPGAIGIGVCPLFPEGVQSA